MSRRVHWRAIGAAFRDGLSGVATVTDRDTLPVLAALRALQKATGFEVVAFGSSGRPRVDARRFYSVRLSRPGQRPTGAMVSVELEEDRPSLFPPRFVASA